jgi:hypothetical protein
MGISAKMKKSSEFWLNVNVGYDGDVYLTIVLNGLIHTIMYTCYFVDLHTKDIWCLETMDLINDHRSHLPPSSLPHYPKVIQYFTCNNPI